MPLQHRLATWEGLPVSAWRAAWHLPQLQVLGVTGSTNDDVRRLGEAGAPSGAVVIAEQQTAGRGRRGRNWLGLPGQSLHFSMLLRAPEAGFRCLTAAPVRVGLLTTRAIREQTRLDARLKWPNDVQVQGRKLGGILCESVLDQRPFLVVGIGINVTQQPPDFPPELRLSATSVQAATGEQTAVQRTQIAGAIARQLLDRANTIAEPLNTAELAELATLDALRGHAVEIDGTPAGTALGINAQGALLVELEQTIREVHSGTVRMTFT